MLFVKKKTTLLDTGKYNYILKWFVFTDQHNYSNIFINHSSRSLLANHLLKSVINKTRKCTRNMLTDLMPAYHAYVTPYSRGGTTIKLVVRD